MSVPTATLEPALKSATTLAEAAYERIRADILAGRFGADTKLGIQQLKERYAIGASPLREALSRLVADGFVALTGQRGFRVAPISLADLRDVTRLRVLFETESLRDSIAVGDDAWEAAVVAAFHRLSKIEPSREEQFAEWERRNADFHDVLVSACPSPRLLQFRKNLFDQHKRYRSLSTRMPTPERDIAREHREIMDAAMARDSMRACAAVALHIQLTAQQLERYVAEFGGG